jgi:hypothetical protein
MRVPRTQVLLPARCSNADDKMSENVWFFRDCHPVPVMMTMSLAAGLYLAVSGPNGHGFRPMPSPQLDKSVAPWHHR